MAWINSPIPPVNGLPRDGLASREATAAPPAADPVPASRRPRDSPAQLNQRGVNLPYEARQLEMQARISAWPAVTLHYQNQLSRYVVRGVESGGAVEPFGHYVTFCGKAGEPLGWLHPVDSLGCNQTHAVVIAEELIRIEAVRVGRSYELAISRHCPMEREGRGKPELASQSLFRGRRGFLALALWNKDRECRGAVMPQFYTASGEDLPIPEEFAATVCAAIAGACCVGCQHAHFLRPASAAAAAPAAEPVSSEAAAN